MWRVKLLLLSYLINKERYMAVRPQKNKQSQSGWEERAMAGAYGGIGRKQMAETDPNFQQACAEQGVEPTGRQFSKWKRKIGRWSNR